MSAEQKKLIPTQPLTPVDVIAKSESDNDKVKKIREMISALSAEGRALLGDEVGVSIPVEMDGADLSVRKYGYRCKNCGEVALEFLGDKEPPRGVPFDRLLFVQDKGKWGSGFEKDGTPFPQGGKNWRRQQRKLFPRCMHCSQELAKEADGGIKEGRFIQDIAQYNASKTAERQQQAWNLRRPNYRRDSTGMGVR